eukprot:488019_1
MRQTFMMAIMLSALIMYMISQITNYTQTKIKLDRCFNNIIKYNKSNNTAFVIDCIGLKNITFIQSLIHINKYNGNYKIYMITETDSDDNLHQIFKLHANYTSIEMSNLSAFEQQKNYIIKRTFDLKYNNKIAEDILLWHNCNMKTECIYNEIHIINTTIGSNDWIRYKGMGEHEWYRYRLGDMYGNKKWRTDKWGYAYHKPRFPDSIAVEYMDKVSNDTQWGNINLLLNIIKHKKQLYPSHNTLVIHLRVGEVLEKKDYLTTDFYPHKILNKPSAVFEHFHKNITSNNITTIALVSGLYENYGDPFHTKSIDYIIKIKEWFETHNFKVYIRLNENADQDFMYMSNSKYFMQNIKGFSRLIAQIVRIRNGTVFRVNEVDNCKLVWGCVSYNASA